MPLETLYDIIWSTQQDGDYIDKCRWGYKWQNAQWVSIYFIYKPSTQFGNSKYFTMFNVSASGFECAACLQGIADPAIDEVFYDKLKDRSIAENYEIQGDFTPTGPDGQTFLSETCSRGHMLCESCHADWQKDNESCPLCPSQLVDVRSSRKLQVYTTEVINQLRGHVVQHVKIPACLMTGKLAIRVSASGQQCSTPKEFASFREMHARGAMRLLFEVLEPDMTILDFMTRLQDNHYLFDTCSVPAPCKRTDVSKWKMYVCAISGTPYRGYTTYKQIDGDFRLLDIPEFVYNHRCQNLIISMTPGEEVWKESVEPGFATLDDIVTAAQVSNTWFSKFYCRN